MEDCMLSTIDNPYDPFDNFDEWYRFDEDNGYHTCGLLGRIAKTSDDLSDADNDSAINAAIDEIIVNDPLNRYIKVIRE